VSKKARTRQARRDRRKAKQTGYRRAGKSNPRKVGHGGSGSGGTGVWTPIVFSGRERKRLAKAMEEWEWLLGILRDEPGSDKWKRTKGKRKGRAK